MVGLLERSLRARGMQAGSLLLAALLVAAVSACNTVQQTVAFDETQSAFARKQVGRGSGSISGYAFFHAPTGRTYTAGGDWVTLVPATAYAQERIRILYGPRHVRSRLSLTAVPGDAAEEYVALTRRVKADIHGKFAFEDVMPGRWFVTATVRWQSYDREFGVDVDHAYDVYDEIEVKANDTTKVVLSGN